MSRQLNIQHSLRIYLEAEINVPVVWIFDGVKLPTTKPFMTIEQLPNNTTILTKRREAVRRIYRFQVGLLAATSSQRAQLQERVSDVFLFDEIPYLDATKPGVEPTGYLSVENPRVTPIGAEDVSDTTQFHKVYFDVAVDVTFNANTK